MKYQLKANLIAGRRETIYKMLSKRHDGKVPCFVCGEHVIFERATAEHIIPKSKGGSDEISNLGISHRKCNKRRGNEDDGELKLDRRIDYREDSDE